MEYRTAQGFDVHAFCPDSNNEITTNRVLTLCGVKIPSQRPLLGHSDADVALHAVTDAILGSIAAGDIGWHFPPSQAKWKNVASDIFLKHALNLLAQYPAKITFCDLTLICEQPKIRPIHTQLQTHLAQLLELELTRVSLKATTTEKLGFTGRKEGIAALALVNIALP